MNKFYAIANLTSIIGIIIWNYYINTVGINGNTVGSLSAEYANLFTPAGYAFSIWGLIFIALLVHGIHQCRVAFSQKVNQENILQTIGTWLIITNIANASWLWFWLNEMTFYSVCVMILMLISLSIIIIKLGVETPTETANIKRYTRTPISLYAGWISVATIANISAYLAKIGWTGNWEAVNWTVLMIIIATALNLWLLFSRNLRVYAGVGAWALIAIAVRHWDNILILQYTALLGAILLIASIIYQSMNNKSKELSKHVKKVEEKIMKTA